MTAPGAVIESLASLSAESILASPKSRIFTLNAGAPACWAMTFPGLRSRCTTPSACAAAIPLSSWSNKSAASAGASALSRSRTAQSNPLDPLHDNVRPFAFDRAEVVNADDVRMIQPGGGSRLAVKAAQGFRIAEVTAEQDLHGDRPIQLQITRLVNGSHAAPTDQLIQP